MIPRAQGSASAEKPSLNLSLRHTVEHSFLTPEHLTYDIKMNYPSVHRPQQKRKHPKSITYSLQTAQYLPHTHLLSAEMREKHVSAVVGDTLVEMQARAQQGLEQSGGRI